MKYKLFYGLFGCSSDGILYTPSCKHSIKLPKYISFKIQTLINEFAYVGKEGTNLIFNKGEAKMSTFIISQENAKDIKIEASEFFIQDGYTIFVNSNRENIALFSGVVGVIKEGLIK